MGEEGEKGHWGFSSALTYLVGPVMRHVHRSWRCNHLQIAPSWSGLPENFIFLHWMEGATCAVFLTLCGGNLIPPRLAPLGLLSKWMLFMCYHRFFYLRHTTSILKHMYNIFNFVKIKLLK